MEFASMLASMTVLLGLAGRIARCADLSESSTHCRDAQMTHGKLRGAVVGVDVPGLRLSDSGAGEQGGNG